MKKSSKKNARSKEPRVNVDEELAKDFMESIDNCKREVGMIGMRIEDTLSVLEVITEDTFKNSEAQANIDKFFSFLRICSDRLKQTAGHTQNLSEGLNIKGKNLYCAWGWIKK